MAEEQTEQDGGGVASAEREDTLTVTDNRTGETYEVPITDGTVKAMDFRQMKVDEDDFGLMTYDPAYTNTASCRSEITYIDGEAGILQHRGYSIEELCEHATYLEVAYLLVCGELPTKQQLDEWVHEITIHTYVHENMRGVPRPASATTRTRWGCCSAASARSRPSTRTRRRSTTRPSATWRPSG